MDAPRKISIFEEDFQKKDHCITYGVNQDNCVGLVTYIRSDIVEELKRHADEMYSSAQYLTTDASHLRKAMDRYYHFINYVFYNSEIH